MMTQRNHSVSPWLVTICFVTFGIAVVIVPLFAMLIEFFGGVSFPGQFLVADDPVVQLTQRFLAVNFNWWILLVLVVSGVAGFLVTTHWGIRPAFPWQAERFRRYAKWGAWGCVVLALSTLFAYSVGNTSYFTALMALFRATPTSALYLMSLWPFVVVLSALLAYLAGLSFPTHIVLPWALPPWIGWIAKSIYWVAPKIDPVLGAAGSVLTAIYNSSKE